MLIKQAMFQKTIRQSVTGPKRIKRCRIIYKIFQLKQVKYNTIINNVGLHELYGLLCNSNLFYIDRFISHVSIVNVMVVREPMLGSRSKPWLDPISD
jgi:hypothetical protein